MIVDAKYTHFHIYVLFFIVPFSYGLYRFHQVECLNWRADLDICHIMCVYDSPTEQTIH